MCERSHLAEESRSLSPTECWFQEALKKKLLGLCSLQCTIVGQRSRILWLREGDANTKFFHLHANHRRRRNFITQLKVDGLWAQSHSATEDAIHEFFVNLIGNPVQRSHSLDLTYLNVASNDLTELEAQFTDEEVWEVIKALSAEKASGPNGYNSLFYQRRWGVIKGNVIAAIFALGRSTGKNFHLNQALITLLPRKIEAQEAKDFRPISLLHNFAKIVSKVLSRTLRLHLPSLVAPNQSAFIKRHSI